LAAKVRVDDEDDVDRSVTSRSRRDIFNEFVKG
jgi:hypothetical protein